MDKMIISVPDRHRQDGVLFRLNFSPRAKGQKGFEMMKKQGLCGATMRYLFILTALAVATGLDVTVSWAAG
jgi:hypothetical protein